MESWIAFASERWFVILIAAVIVFLIIKIVKKVIKWILVLALVAAILLYGANYKEKLADVQHIPDLHNPQHFPEHFTE